MRDKLCANLSFMFGEDSNLEDRYISAKKAGFQAVECAFPYSIPIDKFKSKIEETGLQQILLNTFPGDNLGFAGRVGEEEEFMSSLKLSLQYCEASGAKLLHIMSGFKQENVSPAEVKQVILKNLKLALPLLKEKGVTGLLEPINPNSIPNYNMDNYHLAMEIIKEIDDDQIRLQLDIFHLQQIQGNLTKSIEKLLPHTAHIQVAQVPSRNEPNTEGEIDYSYVFKLLKTLDYQGWIGLEYKPKNGTVAGLPLAYIEN